MHPTHNRLSRRGFLFGSTALGVTAALTACGYRDDTGPDTGATWTYVDDRGRRFDGRRPARIVAQVAAAAALWDFGIRPIGVFGPSKLPDGKPDPQAGAVDLNTVTSLGNVWGEFDFDKYVSLNPQLLVSVMYTGDDLWYVPKQQAAQIEQAAPTFGVRIHEISMTDGITKFENLAKALGANVDTPELAAARAEFGRIAGEFGQVATSAHGARVLAVAAAKDSVYVSNPRALPVLNYFAKQGLPLTTPEKPDPSGYYERLSWENVNKYPADVILYDNRYGSLTPADLTSNPTWSRLPAVKAGRLIGYNSETPFSYQRLTELLTRITPDLQRYLGE